MAAVEGVMRVQNMEKKEKKYSSDEHCKGLNSSLNTLRQYRGRKGIPCTQSCSRCSEFIFSESLHNRHEREKRRESRCEMCSD